MDKNKKPYINRTLLAAGLSTLLISGICGVNYLKSRKDIEPLEETEPTREVLRELEPLPSEGRKRRTTKDKSKGTFSRKYETVDETEKSITVYDKEKNRLEVYPFISGGRSTLRDNLDKIKEFYDGDGDHEGFVKFIYLLDITGQVHFYETLDQYMIKPEESTDERFPDEFLNGLETAINTLKLDTRGDTNVPGFYRATLKFKLEEGNGE